MAELGYNSVRIPLNWRVFMEAEPGLLWKEDGFRLLDRCIDWCEEYKLYAFLDLHGAPGGQTGANIDDSVDNVPRLFIDSDSWFKGIKLWERIAERYKDRWIVAGYDLLNEPIAPGTEGGYTTHWPTGEVTSIYDACMKYKENGTGLVILAGNDYGMGSSRDWAAKGTNLLGIKTVIAESYERIHRSNLVLMGVLPLQFKNGESAETLGLTGKEVIDVQIDENVRPRDFVKVTATDDQGNKKEFEALVRFDSEVEIDYYRHGGILPMVLREKLK